MTLKMAKIVSPYDLDAERALLGAVLLNREACRAMFQLRRGDFCGEAHRVIFDRMRQLHKAGEQVDLLSLCEALTDAGELQVVGGPAALVLLVTSPTGTMTAQNVDAYVGHIRDAALKRQLVQLGMTLQSQARNGHNPLDLIERLKTRTDQLKRRAARDAALPPKARRGSSQFDNVQRQTNLPFSAQADRIQATILEYLGQQTYPVRHRGICSAVKGDPVTKMRVLRALVDHGAVVRAGRGVRGDPYQYRAANEQDRQPRDSIPPWAPASEPLDDDEVLDLFREAQSPLTSGEVMIFFERDEALVKQHLAGMVRRKLVREVPTRGAPGFLLEKGWVCRRCGHHQWWRSVYGKRTYCFTCHPPAVPELVASHGGLA